jgi:hypothetical protein
MGVEVWGEHDSAGTQQDQFLLQALVGLRLTGWQTGLYSSCGLDVPQHCFTAQQQGTDREWDKGASSVHSVEQSWWTSAAWDPERVQMRGFFWMANKIRMSVHNWNWTRNRGCISTLQLLLPMLNFLGRHRYNVL